MNRLLAVLTMLAPVGLALAGCGPSYSPNTYASNAAQQANKVESGVIAGVRKVQISASGTVGGVAGAAAGGVAGAQVVGVGSTSAFTAIGGSLLGGIAGVTAEHIVGDTNGFEYIVRKANGDMISVAQKDEKPLRVGQKVLVIGGAPGKGRARLHGAVRCAGQSGGKAQCRGWVGGSASRRRGENSAEAGATPQVPSVPSVPPQLPGAFGPPAASAATATSPIITPPEVPEAAPKVLTWRASRATADPSAPPCCLPDPARKSTAPDPRRHSVKRPVPGQCRDVSDAR